MYKRQEYFCVDLKRFDEMVANDELLEHAMYVANSYGTCLLYTSNRADAARACQPYPLFQSFQALCARMCAELHHGR